MEVTVYIVADLSGTYMVMDRRAAVFGRGLKTDADIARAQSFGIDPPTLGRECG